MFTYEIPISLDIGKALPEVGDLFHRLNTVITDQHAEVLLHARVQIASLMMDFPGPLDLRKADEMRHEIEQDLQARFPELNMRCDEIRRKSPESTCL